MPRHFTLSQLTHRIQTSRLLILLLKLGFTHEGVLREDSLMKGELTSANIYGLLRRDWEK